MNASADPAEVSQNRGYISTLLNWNFGVIGDVELSFSHLSMSG
jgi:hypothetical protein